MKFLRRMWRAWQVVARDFGDLQARVLLTTFYVVIVTIFALIMRLLTDPLRFRRSGPGPHWISRTPAPADLQSGRRQF